ncbi:ABC transporter ATP-binding protein [Hoyosella sp. G463]|uniref:ABC transporter ATP-binding protein n=1 Tax=Lolliginicoccus lacisalsi TaxID=2742202 RepID=A0A927J9P9_9ACTN|nr:ABC transporter ATP-binding protein [Lolliginicoccus lacisalsi]MBD8505209.1 ABC transporter ATP-binding protein [Lolliginicoccus lacisalsi]
MIRATGVAYEHPHSAGPVLHGLELSVAAGSCTGIIGANSSGKTTLARLIAGWQGHGLLSGTISIAGQDIHAVPFRVRAGLVGFVGDNPITQLTGITDTVEDEIAFGLEQRGLSPASMRERVAAIATELQIEHLLPRRPRTLSGGEQQCVAIAAILVARPEVLVLDEPTTMLDPHGRERVSRLLHQARKAGTTILLVENDPVLLAEHASTIAVLDEGRIAMTGDAREILGSPGLASTGARPSRYSIAAALARLPGRPLPVTLQDAIAVFAPFGLRDRQPDRPPRIDGEHAHDRERGLTIELEDAVVDHGGAVPALDRVSLVIPDGNRLAIVGRNGAGKSTLAALLNGRLLPSSGTVRVAGSDTREALAHRLAQRVGVVLQDPDAQLFAHTVLDEVTFGPRACGFHDASERVAEALGLVGLAGQERAHPHDLGRAGRRMLALACVLALRPAVVVLDEPTVGLDAADLARLERVLGVLREQRRTIVIITHDVDFAVEQCDRLVLLHQGRIIADRPAAAMVGSGLLAEIYGREPQLAALAGRLGWPWAPRTCEELVEALAPATVDPGD